MLINSMIRNSIKNICPRSIKASQVQKAKISKSPIGQMESESRLKTCSISQMLVRMVKLVGKYRTTNKLSIKIGIKTNKSKDYSSNILIEQKYQRSQLKIK